MRPRSESCCCLCSICDDCCKSDTGTAFQAQAYNYIKKHDPYHVVIGASDCSDNYIFSDISATKPVVEPTAKLSDAVIGFGQQPHTQLSLDYVMIENCKMVILSRFVALSVSLTRKMSPLQTAAAFRAIATAAHGQLASGMTDGCGTASRLSLSATAPVSAQTGRRSPTPARARPS